MIDSGRKIAMLLHFKKRLKQRFGIKLSNEDLNFLKLEIKNYFNKPLVIDSDNGRTANKFILNDQEIIIIYDWEYDEFVTAMRSNCLVYNDKTKQWEIKKFGNKRPLVNLKEKLATKFVSL